MKRDMRKWIYELSNSIDRHAMPVMTYPGLDIAGRKIMDVITDGHKQFECIEALSKVYPTAAVMTVMDLSAESEAFGSRVMYSDNEVPTVISRVVQDDDSIKALEVPNVGDGRTGVFLEAARLASAKIKDRPVFGDQIGPFSLAGRLFDMTEIMVSLMLEPETVHLLLEKATRFLVGYAGAFKKAGANGIIIAEPAAGLLSPHHCSEFSSNYIKRIVDAVQDDNFIVILHNCGNTKPLVQSMLSTGALGLHFGNAVTMADIMPLIPWGRLAFGNIDPARVFRNGTAKDMKDEVCTLLGKTAVYKNFVLSSGCDIPPGTPPENIRMFFDTLDEFNRTVFKQYGVA